MTDVLDVYMDGAICGEIVQTAAGDIRFTYNDAYRNNPLSTPLSLSMPLALPEHRKRVVLPYLNGLITDNPAAREAIAREFGVSARNPFAILPIAPKRGGNSSRRWCSTFSSNAQMHTSRTTR